MPRRPPNQKTTPPGGGHASAYPGKTKDVLTYKLTELGHATLTRALKRTRMSRSDFNEALTRGYADKIDPNKLP